MSHRRQEALLGGTGRLWADTAEGIGIPAEAIDRIFGKFERAVSARNYGGIGLGLYVTRQLVEAMGGSVNARSTQGQGALFTIELPLGTGS